MSVKRENGEIITFYSYKGGTGRTMALANVACLLAQQEVGSSSKTTLMIDWDLEAPGLHRFFRSDESAYGETESLQLDADGGPGLIDLFLKLDNILRGHGTENLENWPRLFDEVKASEYIRPTNIDALHLMKAGRFDRHYPERVGTFAWESLYNRAPWVFRAFTEYLSATYRYVLVDSRTGLSDASGICTMLLPEKLVTVFVPNRQSVLGIEDLVRRAIRYRKRSDDLRPLRVLPLPSRLDVNREKLLEEWRRGNDAKRIPGYQPLFERLFEEIYVGRNESALSDRRFSLEKYFDEVQIQHVPDYAYGEEIAVLSTAAHRLSLSQSYEVFANWLTSSALPWEDPLMKKDRPPSEDTETRSPIAQKVKDRTAQFLAPYHFVPVKATGSTVDLPVSAFPNGAKHSVHDRYCESTYSGRAICRITTTTPIFIGDKEVEPATQSQPKLVGAFLIDGKPAIPSSSVRGLISSVAEAASNSALRILDDKLYSFRKPFSWPDERLQPLSAVGMIVVINGKFELRPLALPTIEFQAGRAIQLKRHWVSFFKNPNLKVYFGNSRSIRQEDFEFATFQSDQKQYYYMKLPQLRWLNDQPGVLDARSGDQPLIRRDQGPQPPILNVKGTQRKFLVSLNPASNDYPRLLADIPPDRISQYIRGILRVLGCYERRGEIPSGKRHELFIPYPESAENWPTFPIPDEVVERFHELADQRTADSNGDPLPFHPRGTDRNENPAKDGNKFRLKTGDLVYFRVEDSVSGGRIAEISLSSIWRGRVEESSEGPLRAARSYRFFGAVNPNLLPFTAARTMITIAEQVFGFVEEGKDDLRDAGLALASRVCFSHGLYSGLRRPFDQGWEDTSVTPFESESTLKILGSPKPPSPALYFKLPNRGGYIRKWELAPGKHHPQGRKFYLHHRPSDIPDEPWRTSSDRQSENTAQKVRITPIKPRTVFYFSVDFDNFSGHELGLLLYALQPSMSFRHKIGMGKPLGLGSIHIEPVGVFLINRHARYSPAGLFDENGKIAPRYHQVWVAPKEDRIEWPSHFETEKNATGQAFDPFALRDEFSKGMDPDIRRALDLLGDPSKVKYTVHTPTTESNADDESETFKWFVANDQGSGPGRERLRPQEKHLEPLSKDTTELPALPTLPWKD